MHPAADGGRSRVDIPQAAADGRPGKSAPDVTEWRAIVARFQEPSLPRATWQLVNTLGGFVLLWVLMYWSLTVSLWLTEIGRAHV